MGGHGVVQNQHARVQTDTQRNVRKSQPSDLCHGSVEQASCSIHNSLIMQFCQVDLIQSELSDLLTTSSSC